MVEPPTPLKTDGVKVSLDDDIPNWMDKHVPNHQPVQFCYLRLTFTYKTGWFAAKGSWMSTCEYPFNASYFVILPLSFLKTVNTIPDLLSLNKEKLGS